MFYSLHLFCFWTVRISEEKYFSLLYASIVQKDLLCLRVVFRTHSYWIVCLITLDWYHLMLSCSNGLKWEWKHAIDCSFTLFIALLLCCAWMSPRDQTIGFGFSNSNLNKIIQGISESKWTCENLPSRLDNIISHCSLEKLGKEVRLFVKSDRH